MNNCEKLRAKQDLKECLESMAATHYTLGVIRPALEKIKGPDWSAIFSGLEEERDAVDRAFALLSAPCQPEAVGRPEGFDSLIGQEIPEDELAAALAFEDFNSKEEMMCGWRKVHRELHVIATAYRRLLSERGAAKPQEGEAKP